MKTKIKAIELHPFIRNIYWRKYQADKDSQKEKEKKTELSSKELNDFVLEVTKENIELPNSGNLKETEFVYYN